MATVTTLKGLELEMQRRINRALRGEVANEVEKCVQKHVQQDVLSKYEPVAYERRGGGGLEGEANIKSVVRDKTLTVKDVAQIEGPRLPGYSASHASDTEFSKLIEGYGKGVVNPWGGRNGAWTKPRPFMTNAKKEIARENSQVHGRIVKAIKKQFPE